MFDWSVGGIVLMDTDSDVVLWDDGIDMDEGSSEEEGES